MVTLSEPDAFLELFSPNGSHGPSWRDEASRMFRDHERRERLRGVLMSVADDGVRIPFRVKNGKVVNGHHRVVSAVLTSRPIPYVDDPGRPLPGEKE